MDAIKTSGVTTRTMTLTVQRSEQPPIKQIKQEVIGKSATTINWYRDNGTPVPVSVTVSIEAGISTLKLQRHWKIGAENLIFSNTSQTH